MIFRGGSVLSVELTNQSRDLLKADLSQKSSPLSESQLNLTHETYIFRFSVANGFRGYNYL